MPCGDRRYHRAVRAGVLLAVIIRQPQASQNTLKIINLFKGMHEEAFLCPNTKYRRLDLLYF